MSDRFFLNFFQDPLLDGNPNSGGDDGSIPTFDENFSFFGECCLEKKSVLYTYINRHAGTPGEQ